MFQILIVFILVLFIALAIGVPTIYALGIVALLFLFIERGLDFPPDLVAVPMVKSVNSFTLLAVPLFFFVGRLMNESGLTERIFVFANTLVGHLKGGLGHVNVLASMIFAGMSGSATADAAGLGSIEYKAMLIDGYEPKFSAGVTLSSSLIGPIIPPSIPVLIYASLTEISATGLLVAGLLPGILMGIFLMVLIAYFAHRRNYHRRLRATLKEVWMSFSKSFLTLLTPFILVGGMISGIFTATESAAIAGLYLLILVLTIYRTVSFKKLYLISCQVLRDTAVVMFLLAAATFYGWILTRLRIPIIILEKLVAFSDNPYVILSLLVLFLLSLGCFLSASVAIIIVAPIVAPVGTAIGFDAIHFGIIVIMTLMIGSATPPVGAALYATMRVTGLPMESVVGGVAPFLVPIIIAIVVIILEPSITLLLPKLLLH